MRDFIAAVEQVRELNNLSQVEMADKIGMPSTQYSDCINGRRGFSYRRLKKIEKVFNTKLIVVFINKEYFEEE